MAFATDSQNDEIISELNMARLLDEEIDGLLEDSFVGASILRRKGLDKYIQPHNISLGSSDVYVMFSQISVSADQVAKFNAGLAQLRDNGHARQAHAGVKHLAIQGGPHTVGGAVHHA